MDSSALIAILNAGPERPAFLRIIQDSEGAFISTLTLLEVRIVVRGRFGASALEDIDGLIAEIDPEIVAFDREQADVAFAAFERFGKGMGAAAKLNLGDCASYALAKTTGYPLLFKGNDFTMTDIARAI